MNQVKDHLKASNEFRPNLSLFRNKGTNEAQIFLTGSQEFQLDEIEVYVKEE